MKGLVLLVLVLIGTLAAAETDPPPALDAATRAAAQERLQALAAAVDSRAAAVLTAEDLALLRSFELTLLEAEQWLQQDDYTEASRRFLDLRTQREALASERVERLGGRLKAIDRRLLDLARALLAEDPLRQQATRQTSDTAVGQNDPEPGSADAPTP